MKKIYNFITGNDYYHVIFIKSNNVSALRNAEPLYIHFVIHL